MCPESGRVMPAMQFRSVVLPAPDAPNKMVKPGGASKTTSRTGASVEEPAPRRNRFSIRASSTGGSVSHFRFWHTSLIQSQRPETAVQTVHRGQHDERKAEQKQRALICSRVVH